MVQGNTGWVLDSNGLFLTTNDGQAWSPITPPGVPVGAIGGVFFLSGTKGWVVSSTSSATQLQISATTDGGATWTTSTIGSPNGELAAVSAASVQFLNGQDGWVEATIGTPNGGALPQGLLYRTTDGGQTWQTLQMPVGGPVEFVSSTTGWTADSIAGEAAPQFYVTTDGGQDWTAKKVTPPSGFTQNQAIYVIPSFASPGDVVLASFDDGSNTTAGFYETSDSGATWQLKATVRAGASGTDVSPSVTAVDAADWIAAKPDESNITEITLHGSKQVTYTPVGLPTSSGITNPSFTSTGTSGVGWGIIHTGQCTGSKSGCTQTNSLFGTTDGGQDWSQISVP